MRPGRPSRESGGGRGTRRRLDRRRLGGRGGRELGELLGGQLLEGAAVAIEAGLEPLGDLAELGRVDDRGQLGELGGVEVAQLQPLAVELELHPQGGLPQLGVGLGGTAEDQALVAAGHAVLVVGVVQATAIRAARSRRGGGLDGCVSVIAQRAFLMGGAGFDWRAGRRVSRVTGSAGSPRDCLIGFSPEREQRRPRDSPGPGGGDRQRSYDPPRHSFATVRATR